MSGFLCLKWNNHNTTFIHNLDSLRLKESYCDATIACAGKYYPVHRFVLGTCSEYFDEVFSRAPCKHPFIILKDVDCSQLEALLNYMYKGEVNVLQDNLPDLIRAAEALKVKGLTVSEDEERDTNFEDKDASGTSLAVAVEKVKGSTKTKKKCKNSSVLNVKEVQTPNQKESNDECTNEDDDTHFMDAITVDCEALEESAPNDDTEEFVDPLTSGEELTQVQPIIVEEEGVEIKHEPLDDDKFDVDNAAEIEDDNTFVSLLGSKFNQDNENADNADEINMELPQCSWTDSMSSSDPLCKEELQTAWLQSSDYDPFSIEPPFHLLAANGDVSPDLSTTTSVETPSQTKHDKTKEKSGRSSNGPRKYECFECPFKSNDKAAFRLHEMRKHTGEKPYACTLCSYRCTTKDMLKIHIRRHTGEKPFSCPYCPCKMAVKSSLKRHIIVKHIQPRKPKTQSSLDHGVLIGTLKAYKCSFCNYESQMKSNLKLHCMRIHTGEKPFPCALCNYRTTTKPQLEKHMRKHTGEKPFTCSFCPYKAAQKHSLLRHMSIHTK